MFLIFQMHCDVQENAKMPIEILLGFSTPKTSNNYIGLALFRKKDLMFFVVKTDVMNL